jgi:hypothetical protein
VTTQPEKLHVIKSGRVVMTNKVVSERTVENDAAHTIVDMSV